VARGIAAVVAVLVAHGSAWAVLLAANPIPKDCWVAFDVSASDGAGSHVRCHDGDPNCDADGTANGVCVFSTRVCVNVRHVPQCSRRRIETVDVAPRGFRCSGTFSPRTAPTPSISFPPLPTAREACGAGGTVVVPICQRYWKNGTRIKTRRGRSKLRLEAVTVDGSRDVDNVTFECLPGPLTTPACPANATGGPSLLWLGVGGAGSDVDIGVTGALHDSPLRARNLPVCLSGCDVQSNAVCTVVPTTPGMIDAPLPATIGDAPLCLVTRIDGINGQADVGSGDIDLTVALTTDAYLTGATPVCPTCSGGVCHGGSNDGLPCLYDVTAGAAQTSRNCPPAGDPAFSVSLSLPLTTGVSTLGGPCSGATNQLAGCADCTNGACTGSACATRDDGGMCIDAKGGLSQACCASDSTRPCFPADGVTRTGTAVVPESSDPTLAFPKEAVGATLAGAFCVPGTGVVAVDELIGIPGPGAILAPASEWWR